MNLDLYDPNTFDFQLRGFAGVRANLKKNILIICHFTLITIIESINKNLPC
jgi:hypothetical protein